jgi:hypothetical protein
MVDRDLLRLELQLSRGGGGAHRPSPDTRESTPACRADLPSRESVRVKTRRSRPGARVPRWNAARTSRSRKSKAVYSRSLGGTRSCPRIALRMLQCRCAWSFR